MQKTPFVYLTDYNLLCIGLQEELWDVAVSLLHGPTETLAANWNERVALALD